MVLLAIMGPGGALLLWLLRFDFLRWRRYRRRQNRWCLECGYDLRSHESGRCPECGWIIEPDFGRSVEIKSELRAALPMVSVFFIASAVTSLICHVISVYMLSQFNTHLDRALTFTLEVVGVLFGALGGLAVALVIIRASHHTIRKNATLAAQLGALLTMFLWCPRVIDVAITGNGNDLGGNPSASGYGQITSIMAFLAMSGLTAYFLAGPRSQQ
ncbi:MAG TPA: hypothetical protein VJZ71_01115 [Phycisphaerae bacterium]|nr:hypothetical protein [Phycisphaerae bacterium]